VKKKFPDFKTDAEAEEFVATADLSEYDFSDMAPMRFELRKKDRAVSLRLPEKLYEARQGARRAGRNPVSALHSHGDRAGFAARAEWAEVSRRLRPSARAAEADAFATRQPDP
jgi:hypothetical protein